MPGCTGRQLHEVRVKVSLSQIRCPLKPNLKQEDLQIPFPKMSEDFHLSKSETVSPYKYAYSCLYVYYKTFMFNQLQYIPS
jgi:hypothetical protein